MPTRPPTHGQLTRPKQQKAWGWSDRGTTTERGYGAAWQRLRVRILERDKYLCQSCLRAGRVTPATDVDHIKPKADGGTDDDGNLESKCKPCHDAKTIGER
jgi:5-methylcytosine-specific restriction protein A